MEKWEFFGNLCSNKAIHTHFWGRKKPKFHNYQAQIGYPPPPSILFLTADIDNVKENTSTNSRLKESGKY